MNQLVVRSSVCIALALAFVGAARGEDILDHLPDDALGFALVRNLESTNARFEQLTEIFENASPTPIPAPLPLMKSATGLGAGLNEKGDAMLVLIAGAENAEAPRPLLVVPVSDYAAFAGSIKGDASGEICRVTIAGEEVMAAKLGSFAALMNVEHRDRLEALLAAAAERPKAVAPISQWLADNQVSVVAMPAAIKMAADAGKQGLEQQKELMDDEVDPATADAMRSIQAGLSLYQDLLGFLGAEIETAGVALTIDESTNLRVTSRLAFVQDGQAAKIEAVAPQKESPFRDFADEPYVGVAGGPIPKAWAEALATSGRKFMERYPELYKAESYKEEDWKSVEESWQAAMSIRSLSMIVTPGELEDPIYSNFYMLAEVENAKEYIAANRTAMEKWNEVIRRSNPEIKLTYEMSDLEIDGKPAMEMMVDVAAAVDDPNVAMMGPFMEALFGADGKMRYYLVAASDTKLLMGVASKERIAEFMKSTSGSDARLADSTSVAVTVKLLDGAAPWKALISPSGCVQWVTRIINKVMGQFGGAAPAIPDYPDSPPVGFSMNLAEGQFRGEMVWPVESLKALAEFVEACQSL